MKWSFKLGSVAGIGVFLHWTFILLIGWIFFAHLNAGQSLAEALTGVGFILALFTCVVLHEFGHALTAKHYGVGTRDITLLPIGGVARLESIPQNPVEEFWIAIAGPAVNIVIFAILFFLLLLMDSNGGLLDLQSAEGGFLTRLMWLNLFLACFNLLPAFPMDGGRVLRALLSTRISRRRATSIAANIGQGMAILFGIIGFMSNPFLIFVAVFVFLGAQAECEVLEMQSALEGLHVRDAMMTRFRTLSVDDPLDKAVEELLAGSQQDFPVLDGDRYHGILRRNDLIKALTDGREAATVGETVCCQCTPAEETDVLTNTLETMGNNQWSTLPVLRGGRFVGLLTLENVGELVMIHTAQSANGKPA
ncbi:MAG: site-2 protease family protein [Luteolibacter sp.]